MIMSIHFPDLTTSSTAYDTESFAQLLQEVVSEKAASAGILQLLYYKTENGSVTWLLKNQTEEQH